MAKAAEDYCASKTEAAFRAQLPHTALFLYHTLADAERDVFRSLLHGKRPLPQAEGLQALAKVVAEKSDKATIDRMIDAALVGFDIRAALGLGLTSEPGNTAELARAEQIASLQAQIETLQAQMSTRSAPPQTLPALRPLPPPPQPALQPAVEADDADPEIVHVGTEAPKASVMAIRIPKGLDREPFQKAITKRMTAELAETFHQASQVQVQAQLQGLYHKTTGSLMAQRRTGNIEVLQTDILPPRSRYDVDAKADLRKTIDIQRFQFSSKRFSQAEADHLQKTIQTTVSAVEAKAQRSTGLLHGLDVPLATELVEYLVMAVIVHAVAAPRPRSIAGGLDDESFTEAVLWAQDAELTQVVRFNVMASFLDYATDRGYTLAELAPSPVLTPPPVPQPPASPFFPTRAGQRLTVQSPSGGRPTGSRAPVQATGTNRTIPSGYAALYPGVRDGGIFCGRCGMGGHDWTGHEDNACHRAHSDMNGTPFSVFTETHRALPFDPAEVAGRGRPLAWYPAASARTRHKGLVVTITDPARVRDVEAYINSLPVSDDDRAKVRQALTRPPPVFARQGAGPTA
jgi:hypothetical protein